MKIKQALQGAGFKPHNNKSSELVASKFHSSIRNVRIVASTGVDKGTGKDLKANAHASFKAVYINKQSQWRTIASGHAFKTDAAFSVALNAIEVAATRVPTCKCGAKKFKAKSGNVVCADACWANQGWSNAAHRARYAGTKKNNASQPKKPRMATPKKKSLAERRRQHAEREATKPKGTYLDVKAGQLVKVQGAQGVLDTFIGTVIKVEPTSPGHHDPLLKHVTLMWMHNGVTERMTNFRHPTRSDPYLIEVV